MAKLSSAILVLVLVNCYCSINALPVLKKLAQEIFNVQVVSEGLYLDATTTFKPIPHLATSISLTNPSSVVVHYQFTVSTYYDLHSMLLINNFNAGSLVHTGIQTFKTPTGFYMANLNPGNYTIQVYYKSPQDINESPTKDWQNAVLRAIWFEDGYAVSDGIKCFPTPPTTNNYNNWGLIEDIEAVLNIPNTRAVLSAYQLSVNVATANHVVTSLNVDSFHYVTPTAHVGNVDYAANHGTWARTLYPGVHFFGISYRSPQPFSFADCDENYDNNKNVYATMLPASCEVVDVVRPATSFTFSANSPDWSSTDVGSTFSLSADSFVIIMYQLSGFGGNGFMIMRLNLDGAIQKTTISIMGNTFYANNFGLWQGYLSPGSHTVTLEYRASETTVNDVSSDLEWERWNKWRSRSMTVIIC